MWVFAAAARRQLGGSSAESATAVAVSTTALTNNPPTIKSVTVGSPNTSTGAVSGKVTASDPDGNAITFIAPTTTTKGTVKITSTGSFTYIPTAAARHAASATNAPVSAKTDTFTVSVSDGLSGIAYAAVTVPIAPANAKLSTKTTVPKPDPVNGVVTGNIAVTDKDGDTPTFTSTAPANGSVVVSSNGTITYTPTAQARAAARVNSKPGTDKFTVTVDDGHGSTKTVAVKVNIAPSDTAPVNGVYTLASPNTSTGAIKGLVTAHDNENDPMKFNGSATTAKGKVTVASNGTFTYTPTAAARHAASADGATVQDTTDTFTVNVVDKWGATTAVPVTVNILSKNTAPGKGKASVGKADYITGVVTGTVSATDPEKDVLTYSGSATTTQGSVVVNTDGTFAYTPTGTARINAAAPGATSADKNFTFTVTADDGHGGTTPVTVTAAISPNKAPVQGSVNWNVSGATTITGTVTATDPDSDPLTFSGSASTGKGSVTVNADGTFTYNPTATASHAASANNASAADQQDTFTVNVSDGRGAVTPIAVTVPVMPTDTAPTVVNRSFNINENYQLMGSVLTNGGASDAEGDAMTVTTVSPTSHGSLTLNTDGTFSYNPADNYTGADSFNYMVNDGHGMASPGTANITVNYVAPPPPPPPSGPTVAQKMDAFVSEWQGRHVGAGWCVDLITRYLSEKYSVNTVGMGNASDYKQGDPGGPGRGAANVLAASGFQWHAGATDFQSGDIIVWSGGIHLNGCDSDGCGHIGIFHAGQVFDQNDGAHDPYALQGRVDLSVANYSGSFNHVNGNGLVYQGYWRPPGTSGGGGGGGATSGTKNGTAHVIQTVNVRSTPSTSGNTPVAQYQPGQTFNYDSWLITNGYDWLSYISYSGVRRYVAESTADGSIVYVTGGEFH